MTKEKISAIIPAFNEEKNIQEAIRSCAFADEILVVDSFSTDKTVELANSMPKVRLLEHEYINSAAQKNWAIPQAKYKWIFLLDADERTTPALVQEVLTTVNSQPKESAFWIKRKNIFMDKLLNYAWKGDAVIRLFRRDENKYEAKHVHAEIISQGKVGKLKHFLLHDTYSTKGYAGYMFKMERYSSWSAYDKKDQQKSITLYHLLLKPAFRFFKQYILKRGFLDGKQGFIIAVFSAWSVFLRYLKIFRLKHGEIFKPQKSESTEAGRMVRKQEIVK